MSDEENLTKEPAAVYHTELKVFHSFEEQETYERLEMAKLSPEQTLVQLRKFINIAYGMYGYNPNDLPLKHDIEIQ